MRPFSGITVNFQLANHTLGIQFLVFQYLTDDDGRPFNVSALGSSEEEESVTERNDVTTNQTQTGE